MESTKMTNATDREIVTVRVYEAPRELVFKAWTDAEHLAHWWGPFGFSITTYEMDFREGGTWRFMMHGPDGHDYPNRVVYTKIVPPEQISHTHYGDNDIVAFTADAIFEEEGDGTKLTMRAIFETKETRDFIAENYKAVEGGIQTLERLAEFLGEAKAEQF